MTDAVARWARVTALVGELVDLPTGEREPRLVALAAQDAALAADVRSLLAAADTMGDRFERLPALAGVVGDTDPAAGRRIGPYVAVREIGRGGMGAVWEAHRADDQYQKRVAIKMVPGGLDSERMLRRFRHERGLLARLEHRNIATLLDGGVTDEGQPWFAMELVDGERIDRWCDARGLGVRARVELFRQVCTAVQYAHEHLVVHRDLKPGNILVGADGTVKLLDFGVAKLADPSDGGADPLTVTGVVPMTAAYASPEQLRGEPVSTTSDVYSLGVVLYELLTGTRPPPALAGSVPRSVTPPSRALTAEAAARMGETTARLRRRLQGDLDGIVLMALRPEPARRYRSAQQLNDDLLRALSGRPVQARPDTLGYRTAAFVRRNRLATLAAAVAVVALAGASLYSRRQAALARAERDRAVLETARTKQVTQFFQDVLSTPRPGDQGRDITVVEAIDAVIPRIDSTFATAPDLRAAIKNTLGSTLYDMGLYDRARPLIEDALRIHEVIDSGRVTRERADAIYNLAGVESETGRPVRAESLYRRSLPMYPVLDRGDSTQMYLGMNNLGLAVHGQGRLLDAAEIYGATAAWLQRNAPTQRTSRAVALVNQATALAELGRFPDAGRIFREVLPLYDSLYGPTSIRVASVLQPMAGVLLFEGRYAEAESTARRAWTIDRAELGETSVVTVAAMRILVNILADAGRCDDAVTVADTILAMRGNPLPDHDASVATALMFSGWCRARLGARATGEREAREALRLRRVTFPAGHWAVAQAESMLGEVLLGGGAAQRPEALRLLRSGYDGMARVLDPQHPRVRQAQERLARGSR